MSTSAMDSAQETRAKNSAELVRAAKVGDMALVRSLVADGADVTYLCSRYISRSAIHMATEHGHYEIVKFLLEEAKAPADLFSEPHGTPLNRAVAFRGDWDTAMNLVRLLIKFGGDINSKKFKGGTPLQTAVSHVAPQAVIKFLITEAGADPSGLDMYGRTALHTAVDSMYIPSVEALTNFDLEPRVDVNIRSQGNYSATPLICAARCGFVPMLEKLLSIGADINAKDSKGQTPLHIAASRGLTNAFVALVDVGGADTEAKDDDGRTPLEVAKGACVNLVNNFM